MNQSILRLRGLPWNSTDKDIRQFLQVGEQAEVFIRRRGELSTGEAYVEFSSNEEAAAAQNAFNRELLGGRYIELFLAEAETMEEVKEKLREQDIGWVVRLRGLPFKATKEDVLQFFRDIEVLRGVHGINLIHGRDGRPLGEAYVELPDEESQTKALHLDRERMGARYIEVFKSTRADLNVRLQSARRNESVRRQSWAGLPGMPIEGQLGVPGAGVMVMPYGSLAAPALQTNASSCALRLRGLPGGASVADVVQYFAECGVSPVSVHISPDTAQDGGIVPAAHVVFASPAIADAARRQAQQRLFQDQFVEVHPAPAPTGVSGPVGYQPQAVPISPTGLWSYPVGYMYEDLSKLLATQPARPGYQPVSPVSRPGMPMGSPLAYMGNPGLVPAQGPYTSQARGPPNFTGLQRPTSPAALPGQRVGFPQRPGLQMQPMLPAGSHFGMNSPQQQQQQLLAQQQQLYLRQQQQFILPQANPWSLASNQFVPSSQYAPSSRPASQLQPQTYAPRLSEAQTVPEVPPLQPTTRPLTGQEESRAVASSGNLSERQSDPISQNLSLASLHLSDTGPSGRSPAASTSPSAPSPF